MNEMMQSRPNSQAAMAELMSTKYYVKCARCAALLPKALGLPDPTADWAGWQKSGAPDLEATFLNIPRGASGCPVCEIEVHEGPDDSDADVAEEAEDEDDEDSDSSSSD